MSDAGAIASSPLGALRVSYRVERVNAWDVLTVWVGRERVGRLHVLPKERVLLDLLVYALAGNGAVEEAKTA